MREGMVTKGKEATSKVYAVGTVWKRKNLVKGGKG